MEFWYTTERLFSEQFLNRYQNSDIDRLDCKNWLEIMYLVWEKSSIKDKNKKKIETELNKIAGCSTHLKNLDKIEDLKKKTEKLRVEENHLEGLLPYQD